MIMSLHLPVTETNRKKRNNPYLLPLRLKKEPFPGHRHGMLNVSETSRLRKPLLCYASLFTPNANLRPRQKSCRS